MLQQALSILERGGEILTVGQPRPCRVCGVGFYEQLWSNARFRGVTHRVNFDEMREGEARDNVKPLTVHTYRCRNCGHVQLFHFAEQDPPQGWTIPNRS
jgi:predicted Zn-ribbon and HTH transcriptional regulator